MSKGSTDYLIELIKSLTKAEKRSFKLFAKRNSTQDNLKFLQLFDFIDSNDNFSEAVLTKKYPSIKKEQISNLKAHLYKQILTCLRGLNVPKYTELEIREMIDFAIILLNKGFYLQALRQLEKAGQLSLAGGFNILTLEIVELEKSIEAQFITKTLTARAEYLANQSQDKEQQVSYSVFFSNLSLQLYALYLKVGFVRDEKENLFVQEFFRSKMIPVSYNQLGFEGKLHYCNAMVTYNLIIQDFVMSYRYALLWVNLFDENPKFLESRKEVFLRAQHNLLTSLYHLRDYRRLKEAFRKYEAYEGQMCGKENIEQMYLHYKYTSLINQIYMEGRFEVGVEKVPEILQFIERFQNQLDDYQVVMFNYKIACLYFGNGDNKSAIVYLNKVIQFRDYNLREDIQCFARILNLIAHFELGNDELVEYQIKSVYRFLIKMGELHGVQKEIFYFLRQLPFASHTELRKAFRILHSKLVKLAQDPYEKRAFLYLDIISWLECKLDNKKIKEIIREKFERELKTGRKLYFPK
ncbi:MAG TPA: hypothetical protein VKZ44_03780 [Taishania sp.]|nr:hypothetical protein [Taishania sp.]